MKIDELVALLDSLIQHWESEVVEFKEAKTSFSAEKTGEYVSALRNEANLRGLESAWVVFGVANNGQIVGTTHLEDAAHRQSLKHYIHAAVVPPLTIREIHEVTISGKRVLMLEVPAAPRGMPISWKGHYFARAGESLVALAMDKLEAIRRQTHDTDWTAAVVANATMAHLDPAAIARARQGFTERHAPRISVSDIAAWDDATFLEKARLTRDGQITRAALLLLGASTSTHLLSPHLAQMTWRLVGEQQAYEHFRLPFLLNTSELARRIRNVQLRLLPPNELIYREISKYDDLSILEALYNCIAHQDYTKNSRVNITEHADRLVFESVGEFFDGKPDDYTLHNRMPKKYRNPYLVEAMTELNLIDQMGYGIQRMVKDQIRRFLPLPDYDLDNPGEVKLTIHEAVIDEAYSQLMMVRTDLPLEEVLALDRVQKNLSISEQAARHLRKAGLIEGRKPHRRIPPRVAAATDTMADYIRTRPQADAHYTKLVTDLIRAQGYADRNDVETLLRSLLNDAMTEIQKSNKITYLLTKLRKQGVIVNQGSRTKPRWELSCASNEPTPLRTKSKKKNDHRTTSTSPETA